MIVVQDFTTEAEVHGLLASASGFSGQAHITSTGT